MNAEQPLASPTAVSVEAQQQPQRSLCPRCGSLDTRFCYYDGEDINTRRSKQFCLSCYRFWVEEQKSGVPHRVATSSTGGFCEVATTDTDAGSRTTPPHLKRRRLQGAAEETRRLCPRCNSSDTRFLRFHLSKGWSRSQHFCFSCGRRWLVGAAVLRRWTRGDERAPSLPAERPPCPRCGSPFTSASGFNDESRTRRRHKCLRCNRYWTREVEGWVQCEPEPVHPPSRSYSTQAVAAVPLRWAAGDNCGFRRLPDLHRSSTVEDVNGRAGERPASTSAAQENGACTDADHAPTSSGLTAAAGSSQAENPAKDLFWKLGDDGELTWEGVDQLLEDLMWLELRAPFCCGNYP